MRVAASDEHLDLALVDVEGFVGAGVPRHAFVLLPVASWLSTEAPMFRLASSTLVALGWEVDRAAGVVELPPAASDNISQSSTTSSLEDIDSYEELLGDLFTGPCRS